MSRVKVLAFIDDYGHQCIVDVSTYDQRLKVFRQAVEDAKSCNKTFDDKEADAWILRLDQTRRKLAAGSIVEADAEKVLSKFQGWVYDDGIELGCGWGRGGFSASTAAADWPKGAFSG